MSHWVDDNGFNRYTSHSSATNTQGVLVARPATIKLETGQCLSGYSLLMCDDYFLGKVRALLKHVCEMCTHYSHCIDLKLGLSIDSNI